MKIKYINLIFLSIIYSSIFFIFNFKFSSYDIIYLIIFHSIALFSMSGGLHRCIIHKSYDTYPFIKWLYIIGSSSLLIGSAKETYQEHIIHHKYNEQEQDPHPSKKGFLYSHMLWIFIKRDYYEEVIVKNTLLNHHHKYWKLYSLLSFLIIPFCIHYFFINDSESLFKSLIIGCCLPLVINQQSMFLILSATHFIGKKKFQNETARNSHLLSFLTFGNGYHANHHKNPHSFIEGLNWYDFDPSKWIILLLKRLNLAWNLKY